jgi:serine/threonine protein kinase/WD40 repeat protein/tetratricopeptide (TPR) repeat protein
MNGGSMPQSDDDPLGPVLESLLERVRRGERPALTELMARHPELAGRIRESMPALVELEQLGISSGSLTPRARHSTATSDSGDAVPSPERLGDYLIHRRLGGGGMGVVYEAEHASLKNRVALKVMQPRFRADSKYLRRFHAEARLAAGLHHTNIVGVFDYGEQDGVCYYAMQFIEGQPLDRVLADIRRLRDDDTHAESLIGPDGILTIPTAAAAKGLPTGRSAAPTNPDLTTTASTAAGEEAPAADAIRALDPEPGLEQPVGSEPSTLGSSSLFGLRELQYFREIARVGVQVADALEYAHRRGVLHRDIKPSNLLLDAMGNVWVTDFGLAKLEENADLSQSRELVGTLRYMAPERFQGSSDRRGDIYSLGATLYELLALRPLFEENDQIRLIERIRDDPPAPPRQLDRNIPRDLETIVLKALAKDAFDRFGSAGELAGELRRFVEGRPIRSRPVSAAERFWRWCKREPWLAGANIAAVILMIVLAAAAIVFRNQAEALAVERGRSDAAALDARSSAVDAYTAQAEAGRSSNRPGQRFETLKAVSRATELLNGLPPRPDSASRRESLRDLAIAALALPDLRPTGRVIRQPQGAIAVAFDRTMTRYAVRFGDGTISVRRVADDGEVARFSAPSVRPIDHLGFSPDGRYLAAAHTPGFALTVWDVDRGVVAVYDRGPVPGAARFSSDSRRLALINRSRTLLVYDLSTGQPIAKLGVRGVGSLAVHPDGAQIAVIDNESNPSSCRIREIETGGLLQQITLRAPAADVVWSTDSSTLAITGKDRRIDLWDTPSGVLRATLEGHASGAIGAAFYPAGTLLANLDSSGELRLWDSVLGRPLLNLRSEFGPEFSQDGRIVVRLEDQLIAYQVNPALEYRTLAHASREPVNYGRPSVRHDGRLLAVGTDSGAVLWDLARGTELAFLPIANARQVMFEPSGDLITSGSMGVHRWPIRLDAGRHDFGIGPPLPLRLPAGLCGIAADRSGRIVAKAAYVTAYIVTPERSFWVDGLKDCRGVAVSPDGQWLATGTHAEAQRAAQIWRISDGTKETELPFDYRTGVDFSPDGKLLLTTASPSRLWEVGTWREVSELGGLALCFSPDGRIVVVVDANKMIRLVQTETGRTMARLESPDSFQPEAAIVSPDGSRLVVTTNNGPAVHIWDLRMIRAHLAAMGLDWDAPAFFDDDPAGPGSPPLQPLRVDLGPLAGHSQHFTDAPASVLERYRTRLEDEPNDADALHHRAHALHNLRRFHDAIAELTRAIHLRPGNGHFHADRGSAYFKLRQFEPAIADLETALAHGADRHDVRESLINCYRARAVVLADGTVQERDLDRAVALARRAADLSPFEPGSLYVLSVVLYRAGRYDEAIDFMDRYSKVHREAEPTTLLYRAMAHHRLGHHAEARAAFDRARTWMSDHGLKDPSLYPALERVRAEAEAVLAGPSSELPEDVFAPVR